MPTNTPDQRLSDYAKRGRKAIQGWFSRIDAEIFNSILTFQNQMNFTGATAEIGVHHGKSFVPLCLALKAKERAFCIDLFDEQDKNLDRSGHGDYDMFVRNMSRLSIDLANIAIVKGSSLELSPDAVLDAVGPVRFFSVDGGHWHTIVKNDLDTALATGSADLVIALDDFLHKEWPEVTTAFFDWYRSNTDNIVPIALSNGKLYLSRPTQAKLYSDMLLKKPFINFEFNKEVDFLGFKVPLINGSDKNLVDKINDYVHLYHPKVFDVVRSVKRAIAG